MHSKLTTAEVRTTWVNPGHFGIHLVLTRYAAETPKWCKICLVSRALFRGRHTMTPSARAVWFLPLIARQKEGTMQDSEVLHCWELHAPKGCVEFLPGSFRAVSQRQGSAPWKTRQSHLSTFQYLSNFHRTSPKIPNFLSSAFPDQNLTDPSLDLVVEPRGVGQLLLHFRSG